LKIPKDNQKPHIEKKMKHIVERQKDIFDNIDEKEKEEKWKLLLMKFKHGNNAREIILQSKNCNVQVSLSMN
jgi:hypothetical protein